MLKDCLNFQYRVMKENGSVADIAFSSSEISFLGQDENAEIVKKTNASFVTDKIKMTSKEDSFIMDLWEHNLDKRRIVIPSDLFFAKTIPLLDCEISVSDENGIVKYRVVVFDDYADSIEKSNGSPVCVGAVIPKTLGVDIFFPICVVKGVDFIVGVPVGYMDDQSKERARLLTRLQVSQLSIMFLETWYGIQIALLHPNIKEVFLHPSTASRGEMKRRERNERHHVKYVKKHIVNIDDLIRCAENAKRSKKCLAWYVIGHWRHYKDGKKVFVKPYWKGALRELKGNAGEDSRERDMDFSLTISENDL